FRWSPPLSSRQAMDALARGKEMERIEPPSPPQEYELQKYLQQRRRRERLLPVHREVTRTVGGAT
ncbi:MAG TPA: hypothetical protein VKE27_04930, partial [Candidatus Dormibacteraeota bacterium]|nr:hypothetical protein [Candidatus Dormibacteraeota bacterium]